MAVSSNPSLEGRLCNNDHYKSEERAPGPDNSPRGPHQWKTPPRQITVGKSPPHPEQQREQQRQHIGGLNKRVKRRYTPPSDQ